MPYSPLVSKIRVHDPNKKGSSSANRNYVTYIATREGVSLETIKNVNDLMNMDKMLEKELREDLIHEEAGNKEYVEYMARRPRSQGLFGNVDTSDLKAISSEIASLTKSGRVIYRGIISLSEKDGEELGFRNIDAWNNYLRRVMPDIAQQLGVSSYNHTWVAAFHAEEKHPHVHYMLWDNEDRVKSPYIHKATQQKIRIFLEKEMFDNSYERGIKLARAEEHAEINEIRNAEKKRIVKETENLIKEAVFAPGVEYEKLPTRASNDYLKKLAEETVAFIGKMPGSGSFKYEYFSPAAKEQLEKIIDLVLEKPDIKDAFESYLKAVKTSQQLKGFTTAKTDYEVNKEKNAVRKRIGNRIINTIKPVVLHEETLSDSVEGRTTQNENEKSELNSVQGRDEKLDISASAEIEINGTEFRFAENGVLAAEQEYYIEWNERYSEAMNLLYKEDPDIQRVFEILEEEAIKGNALAIFESGKLIDRELLESIELQEANEYFDEARMAFEKIYFSTEDDYIKQYAAYRLGKYFMSAIGSIEEADYKKAEMWFKRASENKYAQYSLGKMYLEDKVHVSEKQDSLENKKAALLLFESSAKSNNPFASYELGKMYSQGIGIEIDVEKGQTYYKSALTKFLQMSVKGTDDALFYRLGRMYLDGLGTERDEKEGEKYIYKAAKLGNEAAKLSLATIYLTKDEKLQQKAIQSLKELADGDRNHPMAQYKLGTIYADKEISGENYDMKKAIGYFEKSAEQGNQFAQYRLGCIYMNGKEYPGIYDMKKAIGYLEKSAEQGNQFAQYRLGCIYMNGEEYPGIYDMKKAIGYLEKSAEQGNQFAQYRLGCIYMNGEEYPGIYDMKKAIGYLEKSAEQGNQFAQCRLGCIFYFGKDVAKNEELGRYWLQKAAEQGNQFAQDVLDGPIGINFSYCLLKGVLTSLESLNQQIQYSNQEFVRTQSRQARREKYIHHDNQQGMEESI